MVEKMDETRRRVSAEEKPRDLGGLYLGTICTNLLPTCSVSIG